MIYTTLAGSKGINPQRESREVARDLPITQGTAPLRAGLEATVSTRAPTPDTMTPDHHTKAVASGALQLPRLGPIQSAAWQTVAA
jgi:hypothetical protein